MSKYHLRELPNGGVKIKTHLGVTIAEIQYRTLPHGSKTWYWRRGACEHWTMCGTNDKIMAIDFVLTEVSREQSIR